MASKWDTGSKVAAAIASAVLAIVTTGNAAKDVVDAVKDLKKK